MKGDNGHEKQSNVRVHGFAGEHFGNVISDNARDDRLLAMAAKKTIAVVGELVDPEALLPDRHGVFVSFVHDVEREGIVLCETYPGIPVEEVERNTGFGLDVRGRKAAGSSRPCQPLSIGLRWRRVCERSECSARSVSIRVLGL